MDVDNNTLAARLAELGDARATGLLMVFADAQVATLGFDDGELKLLLYRGKTGLDAAHAFADALRAASSLRIQFRHGAVDSRDLDLPALAEVTRLLCPDAPRDTAAPHERNVVPLTAAMQPLIVDVATTFIGNSAEQICADLFGRTDRLRVVFLLLSGYISSQRRAQRFRNELRERLQPLTAAYLPPPRG